VIILKASSLRLVVFFPRRSRAITGKATGRQENGRSTRTATITQVLPYPILSWERAEPSWVHRAAQTFLPRRRSGVSSTATRTSGPGRQQGLDHRTGQRQGHLSRTHAAREKNRWTR
jgi:hypothetical protein